jgi:hypothetical protein
MEKKLDFTAAWNDALALLKGNLEVVLPVIGVLLLLPAIIVGYMVPEPVIDPAAADSGMAQLLQYYNDLAPWLLMTTITSVIAYATIYALVFNQSRPTVAEAFTIALSFFLPMLIANIIIMIAMTVGLIFLIVPGIYLLIKFSLTGPSMVAENIKNPIAALSRSWALTKGNSLYIFAFFIIVGVVGGIAYYISAMIFSAIFAMVLPASAAALLSLIVKSILGAILSAVFLFIGIAIYRQLSASN